MVSQSDAEPMMMPTSGFIASPRAARRVPTVQCCRVQSRRHCSEQCAQRAKQLAGRTATAAGTRALRPGGVDALRPFRGVELRVPAQQFLQRRRALREQPLAPGAHAFEGLALACRLLPGGRERGADGLGVDRTHQLADVLALAREAAAVVHRAGRADRLDERLRQCQRLQLRLAQPDERLAQVLGGVRGALARALAGRLRRLGIGLIVRIACAGHALVLALSGAAVAAPGGKLQSKPNSRANLMPAAPATASRDQLADIATLALEEARRQGASQCEADVSVSQGLSVSVRLREVDTLEYQRDRGLGVTVYFGQRKGSASTADLSAAAVRRSEER